MKYAQINWRAGRRLRNVEYLTLAFIHNTYIYLNKLNFSAIVLSYKDASFCTICLVYTFILVFSEIRPLLLRTVQGFCNKISQVV